MVVVSLMTLLVFAGCEGLNPPGVQQVMTDLQQHGIDFKPSTPFFGTMTGVFPPDLYPLAFVMYERRSNDRKLIDTLFLQDTQTLTQTQKIESSLQAYAADPYGLGGLDSAGYLRYYSCDKVIVVYQGMWETGVDPIMDNLLSEKCGTAFIRYPPEYTAIAHR